MKAETRYLVLVSDAAATCGVEEFARLTAERLGQRGKRYMLDSNLRDFGKVLADIDGIILNFPVVAWKKRLIAPLAAALVARAKGRDVIIVLHEWASLDWKRRAVLTPVLLLANAILFSAPEIAAEFSGSPISRLCTRNRDIVPVPPNLVRPAIVTATAHSEILRQQRSAGRMIIGQFGSIYPKKQSTAVLDVAARLLADAHDVGVVFAGSFIKGQDDVEGDFYKQVDKHGLGERVAVTGYIPGNAELFAIFDEIDVFCYLFADGLTSRRGSVLAASLSAKPVVVNAPRHDQALAHHGLFKALIANGTIRLVSTDADIAAMSEAVLDGGRSKPKPIDADAETEALWNGIVRRLDHAARKPSNAHPDS
jgi:glycosyltransferase involved in cell wall biosynthesis